MERESDELTGVTSEDFVIARRLSYSDLAITLAKGRIARHNLEYTKQQLSEAINAAGRMADLAIDALRSRIDDIRELEKAKRDGLTGLWRRDFWEPMVRPKIEQIQQFGPETEDGEPNAGLLVFLDVEDMHFINNQLGYIVGDKAVNTGRDGLRALADYMKTSSRNQDRRTDPARLDKGMRDHDLLCRLGGDEMAAFFPLHIGPGENLEEIGTAITERYKKIPPDDGEINPFITVGYTFILPGETDTLDEYIDKADPKRHLSDEEKDQRELRKQARLDTGKY